MDSCLREYIAMVEMRSNGGIERRRDESTPAKPQPKKSEYAQFRVVLD
jgi:hypothetical protein